MASAVPGNDLPALFPAPRSVEIAGRSIEIKRCTLSQAGRIIDAGSGLYELIQGGAEFTDLFEQYPAQASALVVIATGLDPEWVQSLDPLDQFDIASAWMEVNAAFFVRRLLPSLARYRGAINAMFGGGVISSDASLSTDTSMPATTPLKPPRSTLPPSPAPNGASAAPT